MKETLEKPTGRSQSADSQPLGESSVSIASAPRQPDQPRSVAALALHINSENTARKSSSLDPVARALLPKLKSMRTALSAQVARADVVKDLAEFSRITDSYELVSIDFFDTLVTRQVEPPEYVLQKVAEISVSEINRRYRLSLTETDYLRARSACERALRRESLRAYGLDAEVGLPAVLARVLRQIGINDENLLDFLIEAEVSLESEALALNSGAFELLRSLKAAGKQTVVLSDMYLPTSLLERLADKLEIGSFIDSFYVSGDVRLSKGSGRLFEHVIDQKGVVPADVIHIGDNFKSDYKAAVRVGIKAKWLCQPDQLQRRKRTERRLTTNPEKYVRDLIQKRSEALYGPAEVVERELFTRFAPAIFAMAYKSLRACASLGVEKLYFLAREGLGIRPVFEQLISRHPEFRLREFELSDLYCSRASTVCCRVSPSDNVEQLMTMVAERANDFSPEGFLKAWNIDKERLTEEWPDASGLSSRAQLVEFLQASPKLKDAIFSYLQEEQKKLRRYLEQEGVPDAPCAFVDVGWSGTIQRNLDALDLGAQVFGMYIGTNEKFEARNFRGHIFSSADYRTGTVHKSAGLTETLLSISSVGTTIGYEPREGRVQPVFRDSGEISGTMESIRNRVFADFYPVFEELTRKHCIPTPVLAEHARREYFALVCHPRRSFLKSLEELKFNFDWGRTEAQPVVGRISITDIFRPGKTFMALWRSPWLFGTLKASNLGLLNTPISWILGHEERINRDTLRRFKRFLVTPGQ